ncbi:MAG: tRNA 2-selenouridine(34) synthase MnmH [Campylobacter sp.]|nr:tRNA 2-selenouridine(34) synthase MnmH [Campylobacter sp.]
MLKELEISQWINERDNFSLLIDARSPREFSNSHIKGAKNFYVLNDDEYELTGTIYKENRAKAKLMGAKFVSQNIAKNLDEIAKISSVGSLVGVYCARGGMRSLSISYVLSMIGYRVVRLVGGYKSYRNFVLDELEKPSGLHFVTLYGYTGSFKTKLIQSLETSIDLEKIANHLGSAFGQINGEQPSQKAFENEIFESLRELKKHSKICFVEGESRKIGNLTIPKLFYEQMRNDTCVWVNASIQSRISCTLQSYENINSDFFYESMKRISPFICKQAKNDAINAYETGNKAKVCEILLINYYDKVYKKQDKIDFEINADDFQTARQKLLEISELV